jgi:hypothetical protein
MAEIAGGKAVRMMQDGKAAIFKFLCSVMACSLIGPAGCRKASDKLEGEPLSEVLLRYGPQVGQPNDYSFFMSVDKKFFDKGKWRKEKNETLEGVISITTIERNGDAYRANVDIRMGRSNLAKETIDVMRDKAEAVRSYDLTISDRYVTAEGGLGNLWFPDGPIRPGTEWEGEQSFDFGDLATVNKPTLQMSYRLESAVETRDGRYGVVECTPLTTHVEVPLQVGQLGLKCDTTGKVTAVRQDSDAEGKIDVGDVLVAINGERAVTAEDWNVLYGRFIGMPDNIGSTVVVTVRRDGREQDVEVKKSFVTLGTMSVEISKGTRKVVFDIGRGIITSDEASPVYSVMYEFLDEFPFVDDYMGVSSFEGRSGTKRGPRVYRNRWKMMLLQ